LSVFVTEVFEMPPFLTVDFRITEEIKQRSCASSYPRSIFIPSQLCLIVSVLLESDQHHDDVTVHEGSFGKFSTGNVDDHLDTEENVFVSNKIAYRHFAVNHSHSIVLPS
jgi:hypothetical protein